MCRDTKRRNQSAILPTHGSAAGASMGKMISVGGLLVIATATAQPSFAAITGIGPLVPPIRSIVMCEDGRLSHEACGAASASRTQFNNNWCERLESVVSGNVTLRRALEGAVLDILLMPKEDETLWQQDADGAYYFGGLVGEVLSVLATEGGFEYNALIVEPPSSDDAYSGNWNEWMLDWSNRVDFIAAWMFDNTARREAGVKFPMSFYDLSPVLLAVETTVSPQIDFVRFFFSYLLPFSWGLWGCILALFFLVGLVDAAVDDKLPAWDEAQYTTKLLGTLFVGFYAGLMSFVASGGLGYNGEIGSNHASGMLLRTIWALVIWILKAGYVSSRDSLETNTSGSLPGSPSSALPALLN